MNSRILLTVPYQITRTQLALVDSQLVRRLPQDSSPRLAFDRALGSFDQFAGRLLDDPNIVQRGADRIARSGKMAQAIALESEATLQRETAAKIASVGKQRAVEAEAHAENRLVDGLSAAEATERDGKQAAAQNAQASADRKKKLAEKRTARRLASVEQSTERVAAAADTRTTQARKSAQAKVANAKSERAKADAKRSDADQLAELTTAKRQARTTS